MNRSIFLLPLFAISTAVLAQDQIKIGDLLDLEERVMIKKMTDELSKPNPNAPPAPPVVIAPRAPKIVYPTETLAVYGTSATFYEGVVSMGGTSHTVRMGSPVQEYTVTSITPQGIELTKWIKPKQVGKKSRPVDLQKVTLFAPAR